MKVDFHVLQTTTSALKAWHYACHLIEELYQEKKSLYIHMDNEDEALRFDNLLWTFSDISFIPHVVYQPTLDVQPKAVAIGFGDTEPPPHATYDVLFNLSAKVPTFHQQFAHLIEIVFYATHVQQLARERFRYYREHEYLLNTIKT